MVKGCKVKPLWHAAGQHIVVAPSACVPVSSIAAGMSAAPTDEEKVLPASHAAVAGCNFSLLPVLPGHPTQAETSTQSLQEAEGLLWRHSP